MTRTLTVAHVVLSLEVGGLESIVLDLLRESRRVGQSVAVVCLEEAGGLASQVEALGVRVACIHKRRGLRLEIIARLRSLCARPAPGRRAHPPDRGAVLHRPVGAAPGSPWWCIPSTASITARVDGRGGWVGWPAPHIAVLLRLGGHRRRSPDPPHRPGREGAGCSQWNRYEPLSKTRRCRSLAAVLGDPPPCAPHRHGRPPVRDQVSRPAAPRLQSGPRPEGRGGPLDDRRRRSLAG